MEEREGGGRRAKTEFRSGEINDLYIPGRAGGDAMKFA
jgi:hypothetical protein